ncbi:hypothetical protein L9F63_002244, partial [Diploptera punctata]
FFKENFFTVYYVYLHNYEKYTMTFSEECIYACIPQIKPYTTSASHDITPILLFFQLNSLQQGFKIFDLEFRQSELWLTNMTMFEIAISWKHESYE